MVVFIIGNNMFGELMLLLSVDPSCIVSVANSIIAFDLDKNKFAGGKYKSPTIAELRTVNLSINHICMLENYVKEVLES